MILFNNFLIKKFVLLLYGFCTKVVGVVLSIKFAVTMQKVKDLFNKDMSEFCK